MLLIELVGYKMLTRQFHSAPVNCGVQGPFSPELLIAECRFLAD